MAKRDKRVFRTFAQMGDDGSVSAVVEVDHTVPLPTDGEGNLYVDVTEIKGQNLHALTVPKDAVRLKAADLVQAALKGIDITDALASAVAEDKKLNGL